MIFDHCCVAERPQVRMALDLALNPARLWTLSLKFAIVPPEGVRVYWSFPRTLKHTAAPMTVQNRLHRTTLRIVRRGKRNQFECPYQDSNLGRRGIAKPQHDDLTTNLYGPKFKSADKVLDQLRQTRLGESRGGIWNWASLGVRAAVALNVTVPLSEGGSYDNCVV